MAAHLVSAPTIARRMDVSLEAAQGYIREWQRQRQRRTGAKAVIADCMDRLGISGTGVDSAD